MTSYTELEIILSGAGSGRYQVDLEYRTPGGETDTHPLQAGPVEVHFDLEALSAQIHDAEAYGSLLTQNLFANPEVERAFCDVLTSTRSIHSPLRIKLVILNNAAELQDLHWETLHCPDDDSPLTTSQNLLFSRLLRSADFEEIRLEQKSDLRALVVVANPVDLEAYGMAPIDTEQEIARIRDSMGSMEWIAIPGAREHLRATINDITAALLNRPYHILCLVCHGQIQDGMPWLFLEDDEGKAKRISGDELANRLRELQQRPLVAALVSCESAGTEEGQARVALGPRLVAAGVPVVLAMQGSVSMHTMDRYMPAFIKELLRDGQADRAAAVARGVVREDHDYWMPVLFSRLRSGRIFTEPEVSDKVRSQRVGQSFEALAGAMNEPGVREAAIEYQVTFRNTSKHLENINLYKQLHDIYQKLELDYPLIEGARIEIPENEDAWFDLELQTGSAGDKIDDLLATARKGEVMIDIPLWQETLEKVKAGFQEALDQRDQDLLRRSCNSLRRVLNRDITRVNDRLVAQTKSLQLGEILQAMSTIRDKLSGSDNLKVVGEISQGVEDLAALNERLGNLVSTHNTWQAIDNQLRLGETALASDIDEFVEEIWPQVKSLGVKVYGGQQTGWATNLQKLELRLDGNVTLLVTEKISGDFDTFRTLGGQRFRTVDKELLDLCRELQQIGASLQLLIRIFDE